jgi:hypothetical protein
VSGNGGYLDNPPAHPLRYFTDNPYVLDDGGDLCIDCTPAGRNQSAKTWVVEADVRPVGTIAGLNVVDVLYRIGRREDGKPTAVEWKSILIQTGPDQYQEIFHLQAAESGAEPVPSGFIRVADQLVLATKNSDGGNGGGCVEAYWVVNLSGALEIDFSALEPAIRARVPPRTVFRTNCFALSLADQLVHTRVQKADAECRICGYIGDANAHFRLQGARAIPTDVEYIPDPESSSTAGGDALPSKRPGDDACGSVEHRNSARAGRIGLMRRESSPTRHARLYPDFRTACQLN